MRRVGSQSAFLVAAHKFLSLSRFAVFLYCPSERVRTPVTTWLWPANAVATLLTAAAAIVQPVAMLSAPCSPQCDPHGYVAIFSVLPVTVVVGIALIALILLIARKKSGFGFGLAAAACSAGLAFLFADLLAGSVRWSILAALALVAALAIAGLRVVPPPPRLPEPRYPSLDT